MNEGFLVRKRSADWNRLRFLCEKAEANLRALDASEVLELIELYRRTAADYAWARSESTNLDLVAALNALVGRAYGVVYRTPWPGFRASLNEALRAAARTVRRRLGEIALSAAIMFTALVFTVAVMAARPDLKSLVLDPDDPNLQAWKRGTFEPRAGEEAVLATSFYASNNPRVTITAAALAAGTFGVGTFAVLWANGSLLGAYCHELAREGLLGHFLISIAPHGATELTGAVLSGAAGLRLAAAMIAPGRRRRIDALRDAGADAFTLLSLAIVMMLLAAPIEGFFSFDPRIPDAAKLSVAALSFGAWLAFFSLVGREPASAQGPKEGSR